VVIPCRHLLPLVRAELIPEDFVDLPNGTVKMILGDGFIIGDCFHNYLQFRMEKI